MVCTGLIMLHQVLPPLRAQDVAPFHLLNLISHLRALVRYFLLFRSLLPTALSDINAT